MSLFEFIALAGFLGVVVLIAKVIGEYFEKHMMEDDDQ